MLLRYHRNIGAHATAQWMLTHPVDPWAPIHAYARALLARDVEFHRNGADGWVIGELVWVRGAVSPLRDRQLTILDAERAAVPRLPRVAWGKIWFSRTGFILDGVPVHRAAWLFLRGTGAAFISRDASPGTPGSAASLPPAGLRAEAGA